MGLGAEPQVLEKNKSLETMNGPVQGQHLDEESRFQAPRMRTLEQTQTQLDVQARQMMPVQFAQRTAEQQGYAVKNNESISANKRSKRAEKKKSSRLYRKRGNAQKVRAAQREYKERLETDRRRLFGNNDAYDVKYTADGHRDLFSAG